MDNKPNFFIVGAPKCGTTSLSEYLRTHPNVFMTRPKEPNFFAEDFHRRIATLEDYRALFSDVTNDHIAVGEASITYLPSKVAIRNIKNFNPEAKLIAMVRNPLQMVHSLHAQLLVALEENVIDFERAWNLQDKRKNGECLPETNRSPIYLQYAYMGRLGEQIERLLSTFDRKLVKIIIFDDFVEATKQTYDSTLAFLGVPSDEKGKFPTINPNTINKSQQLAQLTRRTPKPFVRYYLKVKDFFNLQSIGLLRKINNLNAQQTKRKELSKKMKAELIDTFRDDVILLSKLVGRDLTHWLEM